VHAHHSVDPAPNGSRATLRLRFDGLLGGVMGRKMAGLNSRYLAMEIAGLKRASEDGIRAPDVPLDHWHAEAMRRVSP
jgi:hypothetical protein